MLIAILMGVIKMVLVLVFAILPVIETQPVWIPALQTAVGYFKGFFLIFPFMEIVWVCFLWVVALEVGIQFVKMVFGHRSPIN